MQIEHYALILLALRLISSAFLIRVLMIQVPLLGNKCEPELRPLRIVLTSFTATMLIGNVVPIIIDILTVHGDIQRSSSVLTESTLIYGFSNAIVWLLGSIFVWLIYKLSGDIKV